MFAGVCVCAVRHMITSDACWPIGGSVGVESVAMCWSGGVSYRFCRILAKDPPFLVTMKGERGKKKVEGRAMGELGDSWSLVVRRCSSSLLGELVLRQWGRTGM